LDNYEKLVQGIARTLEAVLHDDELWTGMAFPQDDSAWRETNAARALELYDLTSPIVVERGMDLSQPADYAVGMLRDIGDACAILSRQWSPEQWKTLELPTRAELEESIREFDLAVWAAPFDVTLPEADDDHAPDDLKSSDDAERPTMSPEELAEDWSAAMYVFRETVDLRAQDPDLSTEGWTRAAAAACDMIRLARAWLGWARQGSDVEVLAVAGSQLLAAQGFFIVTHDRKAREEVFPQEEFLGRLLKQSGGLDWLKRHEVELPAWLPA
jgi:hypothetical protein